MIRLKPSLDGSPEAILYLLYELLIKTTILNLSVSVSDVTRSYDDFYDELEQITKNF